MVAAAIPAVAALSKPLLELAQTPVIGWSHTVTSQRKGKAIVDTNSFQLRAWELGVVAVGAWLFLGLAALAAKAQKGEVDWAEVTLKGGPLGAILFGTS